MGGWKSKGTPVTQTFFATPTGAAGTALDATWTMMWGLVAGPLTPSFTQTPRDIQNSGTGVAQEPNTRVNHPRFALNAFTVPATRKGVRFSLIATNFAISALTGMQVTDPAVYINPTSDPATAGYGVIYADRVGQQIVFVWGGVTRTLAQGFHNPGIDVFLFGLEILDSEVNAYKYAYGQPSDPFTQEQIFNNEFELVGSVPYSTPDISTLYLGAQCANPLDNVGSFQIELLSQSKICPSETVSPVWTMPRN